MKKAASFVLVMLLMIFLAGCGNTANPPRDRVLRMEEHLGTRLVDDVSSFTVGDGETLFLGCSYKNGSMSYSYGEVAENGDLKNKYELPFEDADVYQIRFLGDKSVILYVEYDSESYEPLLCLETFDVNGNSVKKICLNDLQIDGAMKMFTGNTPDIIILGYSDILVFDENLNLVKKIKKNADWDSFYQDSKGNILAKIVTEKATTYVNALTNEQVPLSVDLPQYSMCNSLSEYDFVYIIDDVVYGINTGDKEPKVIFSFLDSGMSNMDYYNLTYCGNNRFAGIRAVRDYEETELFFTSLVESEGNNEEEVLVLACLSIDSDLKNDVLRFNDMNEGIHVTIKDYSTYKTVERPDGDIEELNRDLASKEKIDILYADYSIDLEGYAKKGLFKDLNPLLKSAGMSKKDFFPCIEKASSYKGKLYYVIPQFYVDTVFGKSKNLDGKTSWTYDDFEMFLENLDGSVKPFYNESRDYIFRQILSQNAEAFIDSAKATSSFDSAEFCEILEGVKNIKDRPYSYDVEPDAELSAFRKDKAMLECVTLSGIESYKYYMDAIAGEEITFIGYPSKSGNGSSINYRSAYAITTNCVNEESAWRFVGSFLGADYQENRVYAFPSTVNAFDRLAEAEKKSEPEPFYFMYEAYDSEPLTDEELSKYKDFLMNIDKVSAYDSKINSIVFEEASAFFDADKSAEDVSKIIKSRVDVYLKETR